MADRTVTARLRLEYAQFVAGTHAASAEMRKLAVETVAATNKNQESFKKVGLAASASAAVIGLGFYKAEKSIMSFDKQMSSVAAVSGATAAEMDRLRDAAIAAGANTKLAGVSASEAAAAEAELVKAGVSVSEVLGGALVGSLSLASAGQIEFGDAAVIAAQAMNVWNLTGMDVGHVADVIAAAANKSAANVSDIGEAVRQGGLVAAGANQSLEQTVGTLALFADNALIGSDAGTSLKTMLLQLQGPSTTARNTMESLGLSVYDAQGNFVGMDELAGRLQKTLGNLAPAQRDAAIAMIFGNDAARAARILYDAGAKTVREYINAVDDQGAAADMAAKQMDNLSGDIENLGGAIEAAILKNGAAATGGLRLMTQAATGMVNQFADMPGPVAAAGGGLLALTGAGLGVVGLAGTLIPRVREARGELEKLGRAGELANKGLGFAGKAGAYATGILILSEAIHALAVKTDEWLNGKADIVATTAALYDLGTGTASLSTVLHTARTNLHEVAEGFALLHDKTDIDKSAARGKLHNELEDIDKALANMVTAGSPKLAAKIIGELAAALDVSPKELKHWLGEYTKASADSSVSSKAAAAAAKESGGAFEDLKTPVEEATEALDAYLGKSMSVPQAAEDWRSGLIDLATQMRDNGGALDDLTATGLDNRRMMQDQVQAAADWVKSMVEQDASQADIEAGLRTMATQLVETATKYGAPIDQAQHFANIILGIPTSTTTTVNVDTKEAEAALGRLENRFTRILGLPNFNKIASLMVGGLSDGAAPSAAPPIATGPVAPRPPSGGKDSSGADFLEALWKQRMEIIENQFKAGAATLDAYEASLDEQMAHEVPWTSAWVALQEKKADAVHYWSDQVGVYLHAVQDHEREVQDNMFEVGDISNDRYLEILKERLAGLEMYSDAWMAVWRDIKQLEGDTLDSELKIIEAVEKQRQFDKAFYETYSQRQMTPASSYGSTTIYNTSKTWSPNFVNNGGSSTDQWATTSSQKLRDFASVM